MKIRKFNESQEKELVVKVKHIIQYLNENFDPEANVILDHDGWMISRDAKNEIEVIDQRGIFYNSGNNLVINN